MVRWIKEDQRERQCWFYRVRTTYGTVDGPKPVDIAIAYIEYFKKDPFGYRVNVRAPGATDFDTIGVFPDLSRAQKEAENAAEPTRILLDSA
ncbi:hypothetical protein [Amycolatopsis arida]|uniref:hypothetical protein n=1 Tax=Amycolatopsis arida TaxID=587909 RepID=UPI001064F6A7|nr:hypothetical protein [Amycolatopsis arida]TDX84972.1 hypothetical protein CLV69_11756 [Amycolatopsis arida]